MANKKVSQLSASTESNDNVWIVMNNSGETETFKIKREDFLSGTTTPPGLVSGTGTDSIKSSDSLTSTGATAGGNNSISIGNNAEALSVDTIAIGRDTTIGTTNADSNRGAITIGTEATQTNMLSGGGSGVVIGYRASANNFVRGCVSIGAESASAVGGVSIGWQANKGLGGDAQVAIGALTQSNADGSVAVGFTSVSRGTNSTAIGRGTNISQGKIRNTIIGAGSSITNGQNNFIGGFVNTITSSNNSNTIVGGTGNLLSGTTSGTTLIGLNDFTAATENNTTYVDKFISLNTASLGTGNTINSNVKKSLIVGNGNTITSTQNKSYFILGDNNTISSNVGGNPTNVVVGNNSTASAYGAWVVGSFSLASGERALKWGNNGTASGQECFSWGEQVIVSGTRSLGFGVFNNVSTNYSHSFGFDNDITGSGDLFQNIFGGRENRITSSGAYNTIIGSKSSVLSGNTSGTTLIGLQNFTSPTENDTTYVDNIQVINKVVLRDYTNLDYADDAAADAGGIPLGGIYHTSGAVKVRIV